MVCSALSVPGQADQPAEQETAVQNNPGPEGQPDLPEADAGDGIWRSDLATRKQLTGDWGGLRTDLKEKGLDLSLSYQQQWQQNFQGGLDTHHAGLFSGSYDLVLKVDLQKVGLLDNAGLYFKAKGTWGEGINSKVGSLKNVNSDASGDHPIFVNKWWYWQRFLDDRIELRLGMLETPKDLFDVSPYANHEDEDFLNGLSNRNPTIPHCTAIGAYLKVKPVEWLYVQAAGIDAQSVKFESGFETAFRDEAWYVGLWEAGLTPEWETARGPMPGRYRIGWWYSPTPRTVYSNSDNPEVRGGDMGLYVGIDQMVWKESEDIEDEQGLGVFGRYGTADSDLHKISDYWQIGASYCGLIPTRDADVFGFSVAQAILSSAYRRTSEPRADRETVYEAYYNCYLAPWLILTPDIQYITNPGGQEAGRDALVGGIRLRIIF